MRERYMAPPYPAMEEQDVKVEDEMERDPVFDIDASMTLPFPELREKRDAVKEEKLAVTPAEREMSD